MSSFFTAPSAAKKRKRAPTTGDSQNKRAAKPNGRSNGKPRGGGRSGGRGGGPGAAAAAPTRATRDDSISDEDEDEDDSMDDISNAEGEEDEVSDLGSSSEDEEAETAAEKRARLAERYLQNVKESVDEVGFDAADIDRDLIAERLVEDIAESKGRVYRSLAPHLAFQTATRTLFRSNTNSITSISSCAPHFYTTTKDMYLHKWRTQDLPQDQFPQTTKKKPKKAPAPPRKRPELVKYTRGDSRKKEDKAYRGHTGPILCVAASPDGKYVVTGGADRKLIIHDATSLKTLKIFTHHRAAVTGLAFRRATNQMYSCSKDRTVKVWSLDELAYVETLFGHQDEVVGIDALAAERCVSVGARDRTARLWKVAEETQLVFRGGGGVKKSQLPHDLDPRSALHEGSMDRIAMIDDDLFVTGSDNGAISLWSVQKKKPVYTEPFAHGLDPALSPQQASAEQNPTAKDIPAPTPRWITALRTIPYSDVILSGSWDGTVRVWKLTEDKRKIEPVGILGSLPSQDPADSSFSDSQPPSGTEPLTGIINDITVFERGEKGRDGICVIAALSQEHRLGRWDVGNKNKGRNGGVVYEIKRTSPLLNEEDDDEEDGTEEEDDEE